MHCNESGSPPSILESVTRTIFELLNYLYLNIKHSSPQVYELALFIYKARRCQPTEFYSPPTMLIPEYIGWSVVPCTIHGCVEAPKGLIQEERVRYSFIEYSPNVWRPSPLVSKNVDQKGSILNSRLTWCYLDSMSIRNKLLEFTQDNDDEASSKEGDGVVSRPKWTAFTLEYCYFRSKHFGWANISFDSQMSAGKFIGIDSKDLSNLPSYLQLHRQCCRLWKTH